MSKENMNNSLNEFNGVVEKKEKSPARQAIDRYREAHLKDNVEKMLLSIKHTMSEQEFEKVFNKQMSIFSLQKIAIG